MLSRRSFFRRAAAALGTIAAGTLVAKQMAPAPDSLEALQMARGGTIQDFGSQTLTITGEDGPETLMPAAMVAQQVSPPIVIHITNPQGRWTRETEEMGRMVAQELSRQLHIGGQA